MWNNELAEVPSLNELASMCLFVGQIGAYLDSMFPFDIRHVCLFRCDVPIFYIVDVPI